MQCKTSFTYQEDMNYDHSLSYIWIKCKIFIIQHTPKKLIGYANFDSPMDFSTINTKVLKKLDFYIKLVSQTISKEKKSTVKIFSKLDFMAWSELFAERPKAMTNSPKHRLTYFSQSVKVILRINKSQRSKINVVLQIYLLIVLCLT